MKTKIAVYAHYHIRRDKNNVREYALDFSDNSEALFVTTDATQMQDKLRTMERQGWLLQGGEQLNVDGSSVITYVMYKEPPKTPALTVGQLRRILAELPSKMPVAIYTDVKDTDDAFWGNLTSVETVGGETKSLFLQTELTRDEIGF